MENKEKKVIINPIRAIRKYCLSCVCGSAKEVELCPVAECELYAFRFGKNPYRTKREMTDEQKKALVERLKNGNKE